MPRASRSSSKATKGHAGAPSTIGSPRSVIAPMITARREMRPPARDPRRSDACGVSMNLTLARGSVTARTWGDRFDGAQLVILPKIRDPRFITVRRGGTLQDDDHHLLAIWAADCAQHVLHHFEQARPGDDRPRRAIDLGRAWARGEIPWAEARTAAGHANAAARDLRGAARQAAYAAAQAAAVGHVAAHELGAAAYAIRAERAAAPEDRERGRRPPRVPVAARPAPRRDPGPRARRPAAAQRAVLVRLRLPG